MSRPGAILWAAGVLAILLVLGTGIGSSWIGPSRVLAALIGQGSATDEIIIWTLRLPRVALAMLAGAALALAGLLLQRSVRNPIASPSVLGIVDGAAVGVVLFLWIWSNEANALPVSIHWLPLAATCGAATFACAVVLIARRDAVQPSRLILYGIALAALAKALVKDLGPYGAYIADMRLVDFKVRITQGGTEAVTRVIIDSEDGQGRRWSTVGVSANIVDASFEALLDAIRWKLVQDGVT